MLRLVLLALYLIASYSSGQANIGGGLDPNGRTTPTTDVAGNLDPNGGTAQGDVAGNLDPDG